MQVESSLLLEHIALLKHRDAYADFCSLLAQYVDLSALGVPADVKQHNRPKVYLHGKRFSLCFPPHLHCKNTRLRENMAGAVSIYPRLMSCPSLL